MAVKMRLTRMGDKKSPFYRVVVIDSHKARDGQYVDLVGTYDPLNDQVHLDAESGSLAAFNRPKRSDLCSFAKTLSKPQKFTRLSER